ncbi:rod-binding protein [Phaeobacter italicus]|uniref:rod-binding protein n=1 Tax=Phaeobacter italicus TaxID=481446 RepID=UPI001C98B456|nr:rod-binding protein [Phaeobacter italicus]MBY5977709.1 rod-binding protein [Phaeobacter italicus]
MEQIAHMPSVQRAGKIKSQPQDPLRKAAQDLEATFLTEMLKSAGLGETSETMGGGAGEDQFSSFLVRAQAEQITKAGGIGLAESLYHALKKAQDND